MSKIALIMILFSIVAINCVDEEKNKEKGEDTSKPKPEEKDPFKNLDFTNVAFLTDDNYTEYLKNHKPVFLIVYASWCHYCHDFMPVFVKAADEKKFGVTFSRIDGSINKKFSADYDVHSFPTIYLINKGVKYEFEGQRTKDGILIFLDKKINGNIKTVESTKELAVEGDKLILLNTIVDGEKDLENSFNAYSEKNYDVEFRKCISKECLKKYPKNDVYLLKSFDEKVNKFSEYRKLKIFNKSEEMVKDFFSTYGIELGVMVTRNIADMFFEFNKSVLFYFRDSNSTVDTKYDSVIKEIGKELREKNTYTILSPVSGNEVYDQMGEIFGVAKEELPSLVFLESLAEDEENLIKYKISNVKPNQMTIKNINQYIKDIKDGKILHELKNKEEQTKKKKETDL